MITPALLEEVADSFDWICAVLDDVESEQIELDDACVAIGRRALLLAKAMRAEAWRLRDAGT